MGASDKFKGENKPAKGGGEFGPEMLTRKASESLTAKSVPELLTLSHEIVTLTLSHEIEYLVTSFGYITLE